MQHPIYLLLLTLLLPHSQSFGQTYLGGNIFLYADETPLPGATIKNLNSGIASRATPSGTYVVEAKQGDVIVFSFTGLSSDTVTAEEALLKHGYDIGLKQQAQTLKTVTIISSYQLDSLRRRNEYFKYFKRGPGILGRNRPENGFGLSLSPVSHFSRKASQQRRFRKRLIRDEKEAYIDYMFSPGWVSKLTGLKADSLQQFMYRYRPSYKTARTLDRPGMIAYIHKQYKDFLHHPE